MMIGIECNDGDLSSQITKNCFENGLVIETAGPNDEVVKFFSPLTITTAELEQGLAIFENAVEQVVAKNFKKAS